MYLHYLDAFQGQGSLKKKLVQFLGCVLQKEVSEAHFFGFFNDELWQFNQFSTVTVKYSKQIARHHLTFDRYQIVFLSFMSLLD